MNKKKRGKLRIIFLSIFCVLFFLIVLFFTQTRKITYTPQVCKDCNVILISVDTLRADHLPCYGYYRNTSPYICKFAEESVLFENAFSQSVNTLPSHMSIFTSLYPFSHGVEYPFENTLDKSILTLPQILQIYNYSTLWFGPLDDPMLSPEAGFGRGYDARISNVLSFAGVCNNTPLFEWLESQKSNKRNLFIFYHTYQVHVPYIPKVDLFDNTSRLNFSISDFITKEYDIIKERAYKNETKFLSILNLSTVDTVGFDVSTPNLSEDFFRLNYNNLTIKNREALIKAGYFPTNFEVFWRDINTSDKDMLSYVVSLYDSEINEADQCINSFFEELKKEGMYNKSIIIVTADHGEEFMEHGNIDHSQLYTEVTHVPLIIKIPNSPGYKKSGMVESIDILPTILSLVGIPHPYYSQGENILNDTARDVIFAEFSNKYLIRSNEYSLLVDDNGTTELYDLLNDPKQKINVAKDNPSIVKSLMTRLNTTLQYPRYYGISYNFSSNIDSKVREDLFKTGYW